ncbi:hypothetical protein CFN78_08965 [Amycolatopsis antarctica]|uniref:DUF6542 domain-containing protein n=1 Tax=Amycolatopsis antarctica TaxID=1854586 RepID=A0A263D562_9PSEU|nr:DUF6542 domain-containing protein [Amycolatopsis antarctica]OZM73644.1 hypothetical protein CFN78_08965 [Amycolatopsis antarctica]
MTAIRDRQSDPDTDDATVPWDERPVVGSRRGLPWWGAVLGAFGLALVGAFIDLQTGEGLGILFQACYFLGAAGAVAGVRRRSLFGPMVQPPLILAVTVPTVVLIGSDDLATGSDTLQKALVISEPLINGFPTMAITTGVTLAIGIARYFRERDPDAPPRKGAAAKQEAADRTAAARREAKDAKATSRADAAAARGRRPDGRRPDGAEGDHPRKPAGGKPPERRTRSAGAVPPEERRRRDRDEDPGARGRTAGDPAARKPRQPREPGAPERRRREPPPPERDRNPKAPRRRPPPEDRRPGPEGGRGGPPPDRRRGGPPPGRQPRERPWDN